MPSTRGSSGSEGLLTCETLKPAQHICQMLKSELVRGFSQRVPVGCMHSGGFTTHAGNPLTWVVNPLNALRWEHSPLLSPVGETSGEREPLRCYWCCAFGSCHTAAPRPRTAPLQPRRRLVERALRREAWRRKSGSNKPRPARAERSNVSST
eukprot:1141740-Prorocentrum_minimum.AAC.1